MISGNDLSYNRFGFVISKKIDKRAVVRNRAKRLVRSCVEELFEKLSTGYDMLFIILKNISDQKREMIYNEIESFFITKGLIKT